MTLTLYNISKFVILIKIFLHEKPMLTIDHKTLMITGLFLILGCSQSLKDTRSLEKPLENHLDIKASSPAVSQPITDKLSVEPKLSASSVKLVPINNNDYPITTPENSASAKTENGLLTEKNITFQQAADYVLTHSDKLLAAQASWKASQLQAEALDDLNKPTVLVTGLAGRYHISRDISTSGIRDRLQNYGNDLSAKISGLAQQIPSLAPILSGLQQSAAGSLENIPSEVNFSKYDNFSRADIIAMMPLYTGGRIDAIQSYAHGRADVHASEVASTKEELFITLIKRYFQVQLAQRVVDVRKAALKAVKGHNYAAQRMLETGLISKVERLQASTALSDAEFQLEKATDNLWLAQRALSSLLQSKENVRIATRLFVNQSDLPPLSTFQSKALSHYPVLAKIEAKAKQAKAFKILSDAAWKPNVSAFGSHQIGDDNDWVIGVNARWTLHSSVDRNKMQQAAEKTLVQVDSIRRQARQDINLLVEKNWLATTDARQRYRSLAKEVKLAKEVLKLHQLGFKEGLNTVIEVNDAQAKLVKAQTQRANAAYEYVMALAELLASTGDIHTFVDYLPQSSTQPKKK